MIIDQIDAFKTWLTAVLKPMCEADPAALAKYVLALIKKDKSEEELRKSMIGQLDVFLEAETESFVDLVFQTLATKDYINDPVIPNTNPPNPNVGKPTKEPAKETKIIIQPSELPNLNEAVNGNAKKDIEPKKDREPRKNSDAEREERLADRPVRRRSPTRNRTRSHTRSRSRSWDRVKRSRSREKSRDRVDRDAHRIEREKRERLDRPRGWRNKSPPRRYDRRRLSRTPSPIRIRSRSRSPRHSHRSRYRNRSSMSRSRSRSMEKRDRRDSGKDKDNGSRAGTPTQDANPDLDGRLGTQSVPSVVVPGSKKRCRDFDEKGYCMRGEMCPFDHGIDPVVLEDSALTRVLTYNPNGAPTVVSSAVIPAPVINAPGHPMMGQRMPMPHDNPYNPQAPHIFRDGRFRGPRPMGIARMPMGPFAPQPNINRELIPVPVVDNKQPDSYAPMYNHPPGNFVNNMDHENMYKKKSFDFNRLGSRAKNPQNCSLELKKVPPGMNSITHLNNHFGKFGKIVNIQVQYEGDPESALITFSSHAEANAAYRSTEAVLNNRFIKVFWHNSSQPVLGEGKQENVPPMHQRSIKDRLGGTSPVLPNTNKVLNLVQPKADDPAVAINASEDDKQKTITKEESKQQATEAIKKNQELIATQVKVKKNQDVQRKQVLKIQNDLRKKKQELLDKQLSQQKILIEKMEKLPVGPQRDVIKETIKKTQEAIEEIKKDLEATALAAKNAPAKKTKEETQKELLDAELDLIAKQQEGADTSEIVKKLTELKAKIATSAKATRGRGVGRRYTPIVSRHLLSKNNLKPKPNLRINRTSSATSLTTTAAAPVPTAFQKHAVDHRPTRLLVSGYETDEQDSVLSHFQQYGEIVDYETDTSLPSITLNYKTRKEAEMALLKGKHFQDRTLSITWSNSKQLNRQRSSGSNRTVLLSENEEEQLIDSSILEGDEDIGPEISEEALLQDDDEEDEEDRSWRR
ncbi:unnamed protein product [Phyllotreta striolata]|uniref:RNA-binding protein 26 n=1 Tax=Phyllotreta striolata TaxID=444603 RepID=A0A9N9XUC6_PHYSR|nr:unnamed protein product [Phyllotreta striolata]